jgi:hypothetical protein
MFKKMALTCAAIGGLGAAALGATAPANASSVDFIGDVTDAGMYNGYGNGAELAVGYHVCNSIASGYRPLAVAHDLWLHSQLDQYQAGEFVGIAVRDLCPQFTDLTIADVHVALGDDGNGGSPGTGTDA